MEEKKVVEAEEKPQAVMAEEMNVVPTELQEVVEESVEKSETQPEVEADATEKPAEIPEVKEVSLTDDDINDVYDKHKTGFQKRIDKLTYEKKSVQEENEALKKRLSEVESQNIQVSGEYEKPKYTREQLAHVKSKAIEDQNLGLYDEVVQQEISWARYEAEQKILAPQKKYQTLQSQANKDWADYVATYEYEGDKELDINNENSTVRRYMYRLIQENPNYYNFDVLGHRVYREAAEKASKIILQARLNKVSGRKIQKEEKEVVKEKLKTQLGSGASSGATKAVPDTKKKRSSLDDFVAMRNQELAESQGYVPRKK